MTQHVWRQVARSVQERRRRERDRRFAAHREQLLMSGQVRLHVR